MKRILTDYNQPASNITAIILSTLLLLMLIHTPAIADISGDYEYTDNNDGTCTITDYTGPGGDITIPDTLAGLTVTTIGFWAFESCYNLTSVTIPDSITTIRRDAFGSCGSLISVTIPDSVITIEDYVFINCTRLTSVTIGESVTTIGDNVFTNCPHFTTINVDGLNLTYSSIAGVLFNKSQTELIQYPMGKTGDYIVPNSVTTIGIGAFYDCYGLTNITIPDSVTTIGIGAFMYCDRLISVTILDSITTIGDRAFAYCDRLTRITVDVLNSVYSSVAGVLFNKSKTLLIQYPGGKTGGYIIPDSVTTIGDSAFSSYYGLTSVTIPDSVTTIEDFAFGNCGDLISVTISDSVTTIGDWAFYSCSGLTSVYFKGYPPSLGGSRVFLYVNNATAYYLPGAVGWEATYGGLPTAPWPLSIADFDFNGDVDHYDFAIFAAAWQSLDDQPNYNPLCDISDPFDGVIDIYDLTVFADNWLILPWEM